VLDVLGRAKSQGPSLFSLPGMKSRNTPSVPEGAQFLTRSFSNAAGTRNYRLYVPARAAEGSRALMVMLHGCKQNPDDFAAGTGMNALAEEHGFLVVYPEQPGSANQMSCWNWFEPKDQRREAGEPSIIAGITKQIAAEFDVDSTKIFVAGLSAGGAMAVIMGATYPDLFSAVGVHSGLPYEAAKDVPGAFMAMRGDNGMGMLRSTARAPATAENPVRTIIFHGDADQTVHPSNADRIVAALNPGAQDAAEHTRPGTAEGRAYTQRVILDGAGNQVGEHWVIKGAGHAWSGGNPAGSYTDPSGPDASREMVRFFML
jgi:poly(hydroxyalkanoate) depolymerase family esterase